jgi:hypothetical protein
VQLKRVEFHHPHLSSSNRSAGRVPTSPVDQRREPGQ